MRIQHQVPLGLFLSGLLSMIATPAAAQTTAAGVGRQNIPIHGRTGIVQEPLNTAQTYDGVERILQKLGMGGRRPTKLYRMDALAGMERGMPVVVHSAVKDVKDDEQPADTIGQTEPGGLTSAAGRVMSVDRVHGRIAVQYNDGRIDRLRVTQHSASDAGAFEAKGRRVIVYSSNKSGQPVAQYFKRKA